MRTFSAKVRELADRQWGRMGSAQLSALGIDSWLIARWVASGYFHQVFPRVYAVGHRAPSVEADLTAAVLYAGPGAMLSHAPALWWRGLIDHQPWPIEVSTPRRCRSLDGVKVHGRRTLVRDWHKQLPTTTVEQALLDFAARAPLERVRYVLANADHGKVLDVPALQVIAGKGRPGSTNLRSAMKRHEPKLARTRSPLERSFLPLCTARGRRSRRTGARSCVSARPGSRSFATARSSSRRRPRWWKPTCGGRSACQDERMQDRARIHVEAGGGGDGCLSFRREAHVPKGGPNGGDGGRGGSVVLVCDASLRDLEAFRRKAHFKARRGGHGQGALRHGKDGDTLEIAVPPGTEARVEADGTVHDFVRPGQRAVVARGGSGGRGNKHFAGPTHQTPRFAERGLPGEDTWITLQLKLLADVGLVGLPNAGKSSLLGRLTRAHPKVADYPFTTLAPVLGTLEAGDRQLVIADIPGLIEGASAGAGLGHDFLAHIERTRLLVHVLDLAPLDSAESPESNYASVERELELHNPRLSVLPRVLALSKADLVDEATRDAARVAWTARLGPHTPVIVTSSATGLGLSELAGTLLGLVPEEAPADGPGGDGAAHEVEPLDELAEHRVFRPAAKRSYEVVKVGDGAYRVTGKGIERLVARYDLDNEDALAYLERRLRGIGVIRALEAEGFEPGDDVEIAGIAFDLDPE
jgi:GTP-binding protein